MQAELREARTAELPAIYALRGRAFGRGSDPDGTRAAWFGRHDQEDPWRDAGANYVAVDDGQIVATLRVFARRLRFSATTLAVAGSFASGTPEQLGEWVPQCYGTPEDPQIGAFCVSEPDAGSDVSSLRTRARYEAGQYEFWVA